MISTSKVKRFDFVDCGPPQPAKTPETKQVSGVLCVWRRGLNRRDPRGTLASEGHGLEYLIRPGQPSLIGGEGGGSMYECKT